MSPSDRQSPAAPVARVGAVKRRRVLAALTAGAAACFIAGYAASAAWGSGAAVSGAEIADAIPGHVVISASCEDTHVGDVTRCTMSSARVSGARLRVIVHRVNPFNLAIDADQPTSSR